jgi:hypothetical protein
LVDFKTNDPAEPEFLGLDNSVVPYNAAQPLVLTKNKDGKKFSFSIVRNRIAPFKITMPATAINLAYSVRYDLDDCLGDNSIAPNDVGTNCRRGGPGIGVRDGSSSLQVGTSQGVGAPRVEWSAPDSKVSTVTNAASNPAYGTVLVVLTCRGADCPTNLRAADGVGHRFYTGNTPSLRIPTSPSPYTFKIYDSNKAEVANVLTASAQNPNGMYQVHITVGGVALQRSAANPVWYNDFRFELERRDGDKVGTSTFSLIGKPAYLPGP